MMSNFHRTESKVELVSSPKSQRVILEEELLHSRADYWVSLALILTPWVVLVLLLWLLK
jgi:hypothetical protein